MTAVQRREQIIELLREAELPLSATTLANRLGVSRQIVVGDVALLRAVGQEILATPRGYLLQQKPEGFEAIFACCHNTREQMLAELYTVVDNGGRVEDVTVENALYGQLTGQLHIGSRYDVEEFDRKASREPGSLLMHMGAGGVHLHRVTAPSQEALEHIRAGLEQAGVLYEK